MNRTEFLKCAGCALPALSLGLWACTYHKAEKDITPLPDSTQTPVTPITPDPDTLTLNEATLPETFHPGMPMTVSFAYSGAGTLNLYFEKPDKNLVLIKDHIPATETSLSFHAIDNVNGKYKLLIKETNSTLGYATTKTLTLDNSKFYVKEDSLPAAATAPWAAAAFCLRFGDMIISLNNSGTYSVMTATCTHNGCTVQAGATSLNCPCHGSQFSFGGEVLAGPAAADLLRYSIVLESGYFIISE